MKANVEEARSAWCCLIHKSDTDDAEEEMRKMIASEQEDSSN